jgi:hypothetical protein
MSEKDSMIGDLECDRMSANANRAKIQRLMDEKDSLHQQLKDLNEKRMKLMNDFVAAKDMNNPNRASLKTELQMDFKMTAFDEDGIYG